jgi:hypothetical protein
LDHLPFGAAAKSRGAGREDAEKQAEVARQSVGDKPNEEKEGGGRLSANLLQQTLSKMTVGYVLQLVTFYANRYFTF